MIIENFNGESVKKIILSGNCCNFIIINGGNMKVLELFETIPVDFET